MARPKVSNTGPRPLPKSPTIAEASEAPANPAADPSLALRAPAPPVSASESNGKHKRGGAKSAVPPDTRASGNGPITLGVDQKVKELLRLAQEQGHLTYNDINDALPEAVATPEEIEEVLIKLRNLEIDIVDPAEVDRIKTPEPEEEDEKTRLDILDDPVRMYLKQMGQVPLLTREQEVEISKHIEAAENEIRAIVSSLGFAGKEHVALAEKLLAEPPRERFDRVVLDKKIDSRES